MFGFKGTDMVIYLVLLVCRHFYFGCNSLEICKRSVLINVRTVPQKLYLNWNNPYEEHITIV